MKNIKSLAVLNTLFFLVHLVPSQLSQLKVFNGHTIGDVSAKYPTLFTPAGITFSIWGVIYLFLAAFCVYHLIKAYNAPARHEANQDLQRLGYLFIANNLATGAWTMAWVNEWLLVSVVLMLAQLATLLAMQLRLGIFNVHRSAASKWFTQVPLSLYFGWIIIATVANASAVLVGFNWDGFGVSAGHWAAFMLVAASVIVAFVTLSWANPFVGLVGIWALYGIVLKHRALGALESEQLIFIAWSCGAGVALVTAFVFYKNATKANRVSQQVNA